MYLIDINVFYLQSGMHLLFVKDELPALITFKLFSPELCSAKTEHCYFPIPHDLSAAFKTINSPFCNLAFIYPVWSFGPSSALTGSVRGSSKLLLQFSMEVPARPHHGPILFFQIHNTSLHHHRHLYLNNLSSNRFFLVKHPSVIQ